MTAISNLYYLVIHFPGDAWGGLTRFFGRFFGEWWRSRYK
jgi:hypothetical protein